MQAGADGNHRWRAGVDGNGAIVDGRGIAQLGQRLPAQPAVPGVNGRGAGWSELRSPAQPHHVPGAARWVGEAGLQGGARTHDVAPAPGVMFPTFVASCAAGATNNFIDLTGDD